MAEKTEELSHEELMWRIRRGWQLFPNTPGLEDAAREVIRPLVEAMRGREIIYRCRVPWLMRIDELSTDDSRFDAVAMPLKEIRDGDQSTEYPRPFRFGARWVALKMIGSAISMNMLTDHFYTDPDVVDAIKRAAERNSSPSEISKILNEASENRPKREG